jgi:alkanesulfonate monooxygenase SsuD/methylene tetrahydromethanopterin reductase-like flavin-dependent oxidoreductase (luciferase family)
VLLPTPARRTPLMIGATGPRMLSIGLPHAQAWNTWYDKYGNTPGGFADLNARIDVAAEQAGREPGEIERSACVLVVLDRERGERPLDDGVPPVEGGPAEIAKHLDDLAGAGADEAIVVASPIREESIRALGETLALLDA